MRIKTIYASSVAKLDSDVRCGGGTDDTAAIQGILDMAKEDGGVHLIMDGAALVNHIEVHSNTTIECLSKDCGFFQTDNANRPLVKNSNCDNYELKTRNITLIGGTYNHNCLNQKHDAEPHQNFQLGALKDCQYDSNMLNICMEFHGVEHLKVRDITIRDFTTYAFAVGCFRNVTIENTWLELPNRKDGNNQDGFHFWGPGEFLTVKNCGGTVGDDIINVGPDERDGVSSITDVLVDGLFLDDAEQAVRLLTRGTGRLDRVTIRNITGTYKSYGFFIDPWFPFSAGNFGNILIENVDLKESKHTWDYRPPALFSVGGNIECLTLKNIRHHSPYDNRTLFEFGLPFFNTNPKNFDDFVMPCEQKMETVIIDGVDIVEHDGEPENTEYIKIYDEIENFVLRNVYVLKKQKENGTLLSFKSKGKINRFISSEIHIKGLAKLIDDEDKICDKQ